MVKYNTDALSMTFAALSDPTRRAILVRLADGAATVGEIAQPFEISLPAISKHLAVLADAGLITRTKEGRVRRCGMRAEPLHGAYDWIRTYRRFWEDGLDSLEAYLRNETDQNELTKGQDDGANRDDD
jgi:DNA-binding transcriptional ArsR family regulator